MFCDSAFVDLLDDGNKCRASCSLAFGAKSCIGSAALVISRNVERCAVEEDKDLPTALIT